MSLKIERYNTEEDNWKSVRVLTPEDGPATITNNYPDGTREIFYLRCKPNNSSIIVKFQPSFSGRSPDYGYRRILFKDVQQSKECTVLDRNSSPLELLVTTDKSDEPQKLRLTHE